jgi:uncharacterized membrane protein
MPVPYRVVVPCGFGAVLAAAAQAQEAHGPAGMEGSPGADDWLDTYLQATAYAIEVVGIAIIVLGASAATLYFLWQMLRRRAPAAAYHKYRANLGRGILLGLEFLVAADIIGTVAVDPTLQSLAVLAGIILIRTFLSFSLEVEIEGHWPWQRSRMTQKQHESPDSSSA